MSNITIFFGLKFTSHINGKASFYKLSSNVPESFCDGPKDNKKAMELYGGTPTGIPFKTFLFNSNVTVPQNEDQESIPLNGIELNITNPCKIKCNYNDIENSNIRFINFGFYSNTDTSTGDHVVIKFYKNNSLTKSINANLYRECVKPNVQGDFLTAAIINNNLNVQDILNSDKISFSFKANPGLLIKSSTSQLVCCENDNFLQEHFNGQSAQTKNQYYIFLFCFQPFT